jgi:hypothetical protein
MDTINGMAHFKVIYCFSPGISEHFSVITLCSSNSSFMHATHYILHLFLINYILYNPQKKNLWELNLESEVGKGIGHPLLQSNYQKTPYPERHEHEGRSEVVHNLTENLFLQKYDVK